MGVNEFTFIQLGPLTSFLDKDPVLVSRMGNKFSSKEEHNSWSIRR